MNYYLIDDAQLAQLKALASRLFTETRMDGDLMRDWAQTLDLTVRTCRQMPVDPGETATLERDKP